MSENENPNNQQRKNRKPMIPGGPGGPKNNYQLWIIFGLVLTILFVMMMGGRPSTVLIQQNRFEEMMESGDIKSVRVITNKKLVLVTLRQEALQNSKYSKELEKEIQFSWDNGPHYRMNIISAESFKDDFDKLQEELPADQKVEFTPEERVNPLEWLMPIAVAVLLMFLLFMVMRRVSGGGAGGQLFNIGKSKAALFDAQNKVKVTFADAAGLDEAKEEVKEVVDFLKSPEKYTRLGGKIPKGVLLVGPPGTGKTLLAKAVAGEAGVPFFSLSGSDFVEMFVGVGAARVRDLFRQAKEKAPCIIFIDEVDAIGRSRGKGQMPGSNDERENTLNSLLVEMDGFQTDSGVIIVAATNRPDILDPALLRPGRFDRQISIDKPDIIGREQIFQVHLKPMKLADDVEVKKIAAQTPGFAGAEIANVCNEAALIAARRSKTSIDMKDFQDAIDRVIGGLEKKNKIISPEEKNIVAYHEAGHAVAGWFLEHADPLVKVSIVPRGEAALGYAQYLPKEQFLYTTEQLTDEMCMALGGRAAEQLVFSQISTGALSDLERITKMAYGMVTVYGMNERIGNLSYYDSNGQDYQFTKPYSDDTARAIDEEVRKIIQMAFDRTLSLLNEKRQELENVAQELLQKEIIFQTDLERLIGKRPFDHQTTYEAYANRDRENGQRQEGRTPIADQANEDQNQPDTTNQDDNPTNQDDGQGKSSSDNGHSTDSEEEHSRNNA